MKHTEYMKQRVTGYWKNAKEDYNIDGKFIDSYIKYDQLFIEWEEMGFTYCMFINRYTDFTPEECFDYWMESDWSFWCVSGPEE